jgi:hypothetical protein
MQIFVSSESDLERQALDARPDPSYHNDMASTQSAFSTQPVFFQSDHGELKT